MSCDGCIRGSCCVVRDRVVSGVSAGGIVLRSWEILVGDGGWIGSVGVLAGLWQGVVVVAGVVRV